MKLGLIPFQKKNVNDFIFRFQFGVEVRLHFYGIGNTIRRSKDKSLLNVQELFECSFVDAAAEVWDIYSNKNLTEKFLGEDCGISSVEELVELFVKILCFVNSSAK